MSVEPGTPTARRPVLIVIHKLGTAGMTQAVLDQVAMFCESGHQVSILTMDPGTEQVPRAQGLREAGRLPREVRVINIHQELRDAWSAVRPEAIDPGHRLDVEALMSLDASDAESEFTRYFDRFGGYVALHRRMADARPDTVEHFQDRVLALRELYDVDDRLYSVEEYTGGALAAQYYLAPNAEAYLVRYLDARTGRGRGVVVREPGPRGERTEQYRGIPQWHQAWLQRVVDALPVAPLVLAESPSTVPKVAQLRPGSALRLAMLHNNQFDEPFSPGSPVRSDHRAALAAVADLDALVVLSEEQRRDIVDLTGLADHIHVVPNATALPQTEGIEKDPHLISVVTRLAPLKAVEEMIHSFVRVLRTVPEARLEIYGSGPSHDSLQALVVELGVGDAVRLMGRTDEPHTVMARAAATLLTSTHEAMPLTVLESQAAGTPVVAYACHYGPATLIDDGRTGRVVPWGDREALAEGMIGYLSDPSEARKAGERARQEIVAGHAHDVVRARWEALFAQLEKGLEARA